MRRVKKTSIVCLAIVSFATLGAVVHNETYIDNHCIAKVEFDKQLPVSHPQNRCALNQNDNKVSWLSWLVGGADSYQFHYLDLFELLFRDSDADSPAYKHNPTR